MEITMAVTFSYPVATPTLTLELNSPELGDIYTMDIGIINRVNKGNELRVVYDSDWPIVRTKSLTFTRISNAKKEEIITFLETVQGLQVSYEDQHGNIWYVYIINSTFEFTNQYRDCGYVLSLEIDGYKYS